VVSRPHCEQTADVSTRPGGPPRSEGPLCRFALQFLQRFGSFELFFLVELLFAGGEDEIVAAVDAFENPILKFGHGTILWSGKDEADAISFVC
jgi:hypothetical protein